MKSKASRSILRVAAIGSAVGALGLLAMPSVAYAQPMAPNPPTAPLFPQKVITTIASTNNATNGDTNPYGIAVIPKTLGNLTAGDV
ncbi:MAG: hypothetical protein ACP5HZ_08605, partial [Ferrimicrobium sp.]